jgi:hypothetical protein
VGSRAVSSIGIYVRVLLHSVCQTLTAQIVGNHLSVRTEFCWKVSVAINRLISIYNPKYCNESCKYITTVAMNLSDFSDVTPCSLIDDYQRCEGRCPEHGE